MFFLLEGPSMSTNNNRIHAHVVELHSLFTPWPFRTWALIKLALSFHHLAQDPNCDRMLH